MLRQQSWQPSGTCALAFMGQTCTRAHTRTEGNCYPQIICHGLEACGDQRAWLLRGQWLALQPLTYFLQPQIQMLNLP